MFLLMVFTVVIFFLIAKLFNAKLNLILKSMKITVDTFTLLGFFKVTLVSP